MNHATAHWNRVLQRFISNPDLFKGVNSTCRNREINRPPADDVPFARISASFIKIHFVSTPAEVRCE
jgi:hypothetical protein